MVPCPTLLSELKLQGSPLGMRARGRNLQGSLLPRQRNPERLPESLDLSRKTAKALVLEGQSRL
jgi:hypothetical protein